MGIHDDTRYGRDFWRGRHVVGVCEPARGADTTVGYGHIQTQPIRKHAPVIRIKRLYPDAIIPTYARDGDAGMDLYSIDHFTLRPHETLPCRTGIAIAIPKGYEGQVRARSGLALCGLGVANAPGTIDSGYRGEVVVLLHNTCAHDSWTITSGKRIAQLIIAPVATAQLVEVDELDETERGAGGFGSTGE